MPISTVLGCNAISQNILGPNNTTSRPTHGSWFIVEFIVSSPHSLARSRPHTESRLPSRTPAATRCFLHTGCCQRLTISVYRTLPLHPTTSPSQCLTFTLARSTLPHSHILSLFLLLTSHQIEDPSTMRRDTISSYMTM